MTDAASDSGANRYTVISADCHGGGDIPDYRPYLEHALLDEFDAWRAGFDNPYDDLRDADAYRNWDHDRRLAELEADGVAAEVMYGFDVEALAPLAARIGPTPDDLGQTGDDLAKWDALAAAGRPWLTGVEAIQTVVAE
jgi:hypothetical protein